MTRAPSNLLQVRSLLLTHLNVDERTYRAADLEPAEVGIVGDPAHRGGYHCGSDRVVGGDYSVVESPRDQGGLTLDAAALDVGGFEVRSGGRTHTLASFSLWCVGQCAANAPDTRDIREIIYSPDGSTVKRWDRLGKRSSGDSSHRWHTHFSFFRDSIKAGRDQRPLFRRYLSSIGLLEDDDMTPDQATQLARVDKAMAAFARQLGDLHWVFVHGPSGSGAYVGKWMTEMAAVAGVDEGELQQIVDAARQGASEAATAALAALTPAAIADEVVEALPADQAKQVVDELTRRLAA
ncbi:hypothetical protein AB0A95_30825 [Micromonospora sp. NPDC049230]|uniref:hypothetical protein n=1 Tax=Micromonospora sp. NPDC049230 TaxID=3155502 RepID=UPI0033F77EA8